ncbi:MAG: ParB N-terminal domain-containing protein [Mangrovibacterium sp.]|nr:ParB N-terminal domain-containing protein [Mangrovibacterium sp.]
MTQKCRKLLPQQEKALRLLTQLFEGFRLTTPGQIQVMQRLLESVGQLHPVIVGGQGSRYQLPDGFKRFHAARLLQWESISFRTSYCSF